MNDPKHVLVRSMLIVADPRLWATIVILALAAGAPVVQAHFPDYLPGYLIQIPAIGVAFFYFHHFKLMETYRHWTERALLILSFAAPLQNTFVVKAYRKALLDQHIILEVLRPDILVLIGLIVWLARHRAPVSLPSTLLWSFGLGFAGWILSSALSQYPSLSLGAGLFEFLCMWAVLYVFLVVTPDRRFMVHATVLFCVAAGLTALAQTAAIWPGLLSNTVLGIPFFAGEFLDIKKNLQLMIKAGGNGYGNTDNFASLLILVIPIVAGLCYLGKRFWVMWGVLAFLCYAGLLVYSRSSTLAVVLAIGCLWLYRLLVHRTMSAGLINFIAIFIFIHANPEMARYHRDGMESLVEGAFTCSREVSHSSSSNCPESGSADKAGNDRDASGIVPDASGIARDEPVTDRDASGITPDASGTQRDASAVARADAWRRGADIAMRHWMTGIGFGVYSVVEPEHTAPHSMTLLRLSEGGILSLLSFILLCAYGFLRVFQLRKTKDILIAASLASLCAFFMKAAVFGGSFSINGQIVWGFGVALLLSIIVRGAPAPRGHERRWRSMSAS